VTVSKILGDRPEEHAALHTILTESTKDGKLPSPNVLGNLLGKVRGQPVEGRYLERDKSGINHWFVRTTAKASAIPAAL
jgi:hypothetical protein